MSIKDAAARFGTAIEQELIQVRADQMELGEQLTHRINGVDNRVKTLATVVDKVQQDLREFKETQTAHNVQVMDILVDIQRKISDK